MSEPTLPRAAPCPDGVRCPTVGCNLDHDAYRPRDVWPVRSGDALGSRPGCATSIRTAAATTTEQVLLRVPPEPCVGSEVEVRIPPRLHINSRGRERNDGGHTDRFVSVDDPRSSASARRQRRWAPAATPDAHAVDRLSWRSLCSAAMRHSGGRVVLIREGPLNTDTGGET